MRAAVFGGTFNPVHVGHLRLAIEVTERLGFDRIVLLPSHSPIHRSRDHLLPFALRLRLVEAAVAHLDGFAVDDAERRHRDAPHSIEILPRLCRDARIDAPSFVLGAEQFARLPFWFRGCDLPEIADLVVGGSGEPDAERFRDLVGRHWPAFGLVRGPEGVILYARADGRRIAFVDVPRFEVSSTLVRRLWREGRSIAHLVSDPVLDLLDDHRALVDATWGTRGERRATDGRM